MRKLVTICLLALTFLAGVFMGDLLGISGDTHAARLGCPGAPSVTHSGNGVNDPMDSTEPCEYYYALGGLGNRTARGASIRDNGKTLVIYINSTY